jgi:NhaP-type Na+/H+ or K+/H+ antiporter
MLWLAPLLFLVIRPLAVLPLIWTGRFSRFQLGSLAWFGIRGIGSIYYLFYAIDAAIPQPLQEKLISLTMTLVAISIVVHGLSVEPWLAFQRRDGRAEKGNENTGLG